MTRIHTDLSYWIFSQRLIFYRIPCEEQYALDRNSPRTIVTACPPRKTRFSPTRTRTTPPRSETWQATNSFLLSRSFQNGPRQQCAEPVTGSSFIPIVGAKKRETKSYPFEAATLVTIIPRIGNLLSKAKSGFMFRTVSSESTSTR